MSGVHKLFSLVSCSIPLTYRVFSASYADNTQLYLSFKPKDSVSELCQLERCIEDIHKWPGCNRLRQNPDKTKLLRVVSAHSTSSRFQLANQSHLHQGQIATWLWCCNETARYLADHVTSASRSDRDLVVMLQRDRSIPGWSCQCSCPS